MEYSGARYNREPRLSDFYKPSKEMKEYQILLGKWWLFNT